MKKFEKSEDSIVDFKKEYFRIVEEHNALKKKYSDIRKENMKLERKYHSCRMKLVHHGIKDTENTNNEKTDFGDDCEEETWEVWKFPFFLSIPDEMKIEILSFLSSQSDLPKYFCLNKELNEFMNLRSTLRGLVISKIPEENRHQLNHELMTSIEIHDLLFKRVVLEVDINQLDLVVEQGKKRVEPPDEIVARVIETYDPEWISDEDMICFVNEEVIIEEYLQYYGGGYVRARKKNEEKAVGNVPLSNLEIINGNSRYTYQMSLSLFPMNRLDHVTFDFTDWPDLEDKKETESQLLKDMKYQLEEELWYLVCVQFKVRVKMKKKPVLKAYGRLI